MFLDIDDAAWLVLPGTLRDAAGVFQENLALPHAGLHARQFLQAQGVSDRSIETFTLGYGGPVSDFSESVHRPPRLLQMAGLTHVSPAGEARCLFAEQLVFPLHDVDWRVVGFVACLPPG